MADEVSALRWEKCSCCSEKCGKSAKWIQRFTCVFLILKEV